jgi:hypothetical protein
LAWDRGVLVKKTIDPTKFADLYFPANVDYRQLVIGDQGTAELRRGHSMKNPYAVYPTWEYGEDDIDVLIEMLGTNIGEDAEACGDPDLPPDERPVFGQEHRVVVIRAPQANTGPGRKFYRLLQYLQAEFPASIIHVHGLYSYRVMFGMNYRSVDVDPRTLASKGKVTLPSGKEVTYERATQAPQWVTVVGFQPVDLQIPRNRCMFNIKAAWWAAKHYRENVKFRVQGGHDPDPNAPITPAIPTVNAVKTQNQPATVGDKFLCDTCSLQNTCKYFRSGGVCSIPGSEPADLARFFQSRDSDTIIEGLGTLLATQTRRLERGLEDEVEFGELDPEVTRIINSLFGNGVKLAKLRNPALAAAGAPKFGVQVNVNGQGGNQIAPTKNQLTAALVAELEARGIPRDRITPEMIMGLLEPAKELEVGSVDVSSS